MQRRRIVFSLSLVFLFTFTIAAMAANTTVTPTTTLKAETANNTSAPDTIAGSTNGIAASGNISKQPFRDMMYANANTQVYTTLLGWFGESGHIPVGYNSQDPVQVGRQIADMQSRGVDGTFLAWYGADAYEDVTAQALKQQSELHPGFSFAIMIDHGTITWDSRGLSATDALIYHMNYVAQNYYNSAAYLHVNGRPVLMEFGMELENIDWNAVHAAIQGNPMIIFRNDNGFTRPFSSGGYAWGPADGVAYLNDFYWNAQQYPGGIAFGGSAKGFNDALASWTQNRYVSEQCGQTWLSSVNDAGSYYSATNQLPFMMIATWNDYEEGTTIESGIDNCVSVSASATSQTLVWSLSGNGQESTVDHYTIFVSADGQNLMKLTDVPVGTRSLDLSGYSFNPGSYSLYVKAVGKSSLKNQMSNAATFTAGGQAPVANLSVTPSSGTAPVTVSASTAASTAPNGSITSSKINFGDGTVASGTTAAHVYGVAGTYTVIATVTDNAGMSASATSNVAVVAAPATVTISQPLAGSTVTSPVRVTANTTSSIPIDGMWVYVDDVATYNMQASSLSTTLTIASGSHRIQVKAWDINGTITQSTITVNVASPPTPLNAALSVTPSSGYAPVTVSASTAGSTGSGLTSKINFGDGAVVAGSTATHVYNTAGKYMVTGTVTDGSGATASKTATVTVKAATVTITKPDTSSTGSPVEVAASAYSGIPTDGMWVYVDGTPVYNKQSSSLDTFLTIALGTHTITVKAWDINGTITKSSKSVTVTSPVTNGVVISSPTATNTSQSFNINAAAFDSSPNGIASMIAYVDGVEVSRIYSNSMSAPVTVAAGTHTLQVSAWEDVTGTLFSSTVTFTAP